MQDMRKMFREIRKKAEKAEKHLKKKIDEERRNMKIIKRNGAEEVFDIKKIVIAVTKADSSSEGRSLTDSQIEDIAEFVEFKCNN